jgi:hypothetical protein
MLECDRCYIYFVLLCIIKNMFLWTLSACMINIVVWILPTNRKYYYWVNVAIKQEILLLCECYLWVEEIILSCEFNLTNWYVWS